MSESPRRPPHFELARVYQDGSQQTERIELGNLDELVKKGGSLKMGRRGFIGLSAISTAALLAACGMDSAPPSPNAMTGASGAFALNGPDESNGQLFYVPRNTPVAMIARNTVTTWLKIEVADGGIGWSRMEDIIPNKGVSVASLPVSEDIINQPTPTPTPDNGGDNGGNGGSGGGSGGGYGGGGGYCSCNEICICIPVG